MSTSRSISRRNILAAASAGAVVGSLSLTPRARAAERANPFAYCLNTSTIRGQKLGIIKELELAQKAGYTAMEPWLNQFNDFAKQGGDLKDLKKRFADAGIAVVNVIAFAPWLMGGDDDGVNAKNMETMKRDMEVCAQVGALRIAAAPAGAFAIENFDLKLAAKRYRQVCELGEQTGVLPMLEFWGPSKTLSTLQEALYVAAAAKHAKAMILMDVYHLHRGGTGVEALRLVEGSVAPVMHMNDYPADPPREKLNDKNRLMPGDGIAPLNVILKTLADNGAKTALSLELFNEQYWKMDAGEVLKMGIEKMRTAVEKALT